MALTNIQAVRLLVQDTAGPGLYFLSDDEITYFLDRNNQSVDKAALEAAKVILLQLSIRGDSTVDVLSIKSSKAAEAYRLALQMFIRNPDTNRILQNASGYAGGVSISDMQANVDNLDNNIVVSPVAEDQTTPTSFFTI